MSGIPDFDRNEYEVREEGEAEWTKCVATCLRQVAEGYCATRGLTEDTRVEVRSGGHITKFLVTFDQIPRYQARALT